ncbi:uncharacterized protein PV09_08865 [Verruconis gallopava]|uniref:Uncharacterized protein n=1 Tax=Verruconis gallopava TaxID=253628 RepID=A0A0D2AKC2_9PEZI|nr:uncharacterized protein PV09_08865 [Verruconis gallopava]KIV99433.1 hypothetical protein PV09_08865 [Verruconis gallopava]
MDALQGHDDSDLPSYDFEDLNTEMIMEIQDGSTSNVKRTMMFVLGLKVLCIAEACWCWLFERARDRGDREAYVALGEQRRQLNRLEQMRVYGGAKFIHFAYRLPRGVGGVEHDEEDMPPGYTVKELVPTTSPPPASEADFMPAGWTGQAKETSTHKRKASTTSAAVRRSPRLHGGQR